MDDRESVSTYATIVTILAIISVVIGLQNCVYKFGEKFSDWLDEKRKDQINLDDERQAVRNNALANRAALFSWARDAGIVKGFTADENAFDRRMDQLGATFAEKNNAWLALQAEVERRRNTVGFGPDAPTKEQLAQRKELEEDARRRRPNVPVNQTVN